MAFGWSVGDIIAGFKLVWDVWEAVSDGPLGADSEATQFFQEFRMITSRLDDLGERIKPSSKNSDFSDASQQLKQRCADFLKRHMLLIQGVNPQAKASNGSLPVWLRRCTFSRDQIQKLYLQVSWPFERDQVSELGTKLILYLNLAMYDIAQDTNTVVHKIRQSNQELLSSNIKLVSSHLDLVSLVTLNLKRVAYPLEPGVHTRQIDYSMLRQLEQALSPPRPLQQLEYHNEPPYPWRQGNIEGTPAAVARPLPILGSSGQSDESERRHIMSERLENLAMRRVETIHSESSATSDSTIEGPVDTLMSKLRTMREQIFDAVGIQPNQGTLPTPIKISSSQTGAQGALIKELEAWHLLEERIQREILHPAHLIVQSSTSSDPTTQRSPRSSGSSFRDTMPSISTTPLGTSPRDTSLGIPYGSPTHNREFFENFQDFNGHSRALSTASSSSLSSSIRVDPSISVYIYIQYPKFGIYGTIHSITRSEKGDVVAIHSISQDHRIEIRHTPDPSTASPCETAMTPFLDNHHVHKDDSHKFRVQMKGSHRLKITSTDHNSHQKVERYSCPPIYIFSNQKDYLEFQYLILLKEVVLCVDIQWIKTTRDRDKQSNYVTLRVLRDPVSRARSILYFRGCSPNAYGPWGFEEWPVAIFQKPKEPNRRTATLTLESADGQPLSTAKNRTPSFKRQSTQGSITTIGSQESSSGAYGRLQERAGKRIRGLIVEFYDANDCHAFWKEFTTEESIFDNISPGTSELGGNDPRQNMAELSAGSSRSDLA